MHGPKADNIGGGWAIRGGKVISDLVHHLTTMVVGWEAGPVPGTSPSTSPATGYRAAVAPFVVVAPRQSKHTFTASLTVRLLCFPRQKQRQ